MIKEILHNIYSWSEYCEEKNLNFNGYLVIGKDESVIVDPPSLENNKWDLCKGCPDPMIHNGNLVPSCLLERIKKGEKIRLF